MSRELEFEELLYYVVELKDKLNTKLDAQTVKINHQGSIINQQGQIVDELCWQLRELSEKVRDLRAENRRLRDRVDQFCPHCAECHCGVTTYENHIVDKYNELLVVDNGTNKTTATTTTPSPSFTPPALVMTSDESDKSVQTTVEGHGQQQQENRQTYQKIDEYSQVVKKPEATGGSTKKKWLFGGTSDKKEPTAPSSSIMSTDSKTIWYIDDESIYEPIELSAKPTTRAQLEKISAEIVSNAPKPAPRRLYSAQAVDNLTQYFHQDGSSLCEIEEFDEEDVDDDGSFGERTSSDVMLRPTHHVKSFGRESQRGSSMVACSRIADLDLSHLPEEECISRENIVRFTVSSRPATVQPTTSGDKAAPDNRRHAIRSYM